MPLFIDQLQREVHLPAVPQRIVSLVPSQTELLAHLHLEKEVTGITKFCIHPYTWFNSKTRIGGTKKLDIEKIKSLNPDLIIANKEENVKEQVESLSKEFPVWISDVYDLPTALVMIEEIGKITGREELATELSDSISKSFADLRTLKLPALRTLYLIWREPYMTIGGDTFIHQMMAYAGLENVYKSKTRYPIVKPENIYHTDCELILLSSEPYPFREKHKIELEQYVRNNNTRAAKIQLVDGEMFSWFGSRLLHAPAYLRQLRESI